MTDYLILAALVGASGFVGWRLRALDQGQRHIATSLGQSHLGVSASLTALQQQVSALEQQQDALCDVIREAGQRISGFTFPALPEPRVVTVEVPVKQGVTQQVIAAPPRKQVCLVLMDKNERDVDGVMWVPPHKRAQTVTWDESKYACASGSIAEGHFVYREVV